ncbi:hypothetical protein [Neisseria sp. 74A18]|uniref:hypothetical protein n=1 Tax=Neisseria sp. 74A18 TaxID=1696094 RepID=UPI0006CAD479|nr:hypothetical protein [Neisseria sp. 74A18]KPN73772.1 hypothetical protein AKG43_06155 [Neisseria sp. 74A18]
MLNLYKQKQSFCKMNYIIQKKFYPNLNNTSSKESLIYCSGLINTIWNRWNYFWRSYWIANSIGGIDLYNRSIVPIKNNSRRYTDLQACHYIIKHVIQGRRHLFGEELLGSHQEITWGDPNKIEEIASKFLNISTISSFHSGQMSIILNLLPLYKIDIMHCQKIRNVYMHLTNDNIKNILMPISNYYSFSDTANKDILHILKAIHIQNHKPCVLNISQQMTAMILSI